MRPHLLAEARVPTWTAVSERDDHAFRLWELGRLDDEPLPGQGALF